jgi:carbamate kinase
MNNNMFASKTIVTLDESLLENTGDQLKSIKEISKIIVNYIINKKEQTIIIPGNHMQLEMINSTFEKGNNINSKIPMLPLSECYAMSQGYIGYHLQQSIYNEFLIRNIKILPIALITQTLVNIQDADYLNPNTLIGDFYDENTAQQLAKNNR